MDLLLILTVFLAILFEYPAFASGVCKKDSSLPNEIYSSQPELIRLAREDTPTEQPLEPFFWGNPCNYPDGIKDDSDDWDKRNLSKLALDFDTKVWETKVDLVKLKDLFAMAVYGATNFERLFPLYKDEKWLQSMPWVTNDVLPKEKVIFQQMYDDEINWNELDTFLPKLHKATKMVMAGLRAVSFYGICHETVIRDGTIRAKLDTLTRNLRMGLCDFSKYLEKRQLKSEWMYQLEEPTLFDTGMSFLIVRDAIMFLEYLDQIFEKLAT